MSTTERDHIERVTTLFDEWSTNGRAEGMEDGHTPMARTAFERLGVAAGYTYLDIGCGNGYTVRWAAGIDPTVQAIGIDVSGGMVERARSQSTAFENARFIHAPFPLPILKAQSFDCILSMEAFYYFKELQWALVSTIRLLKPGGLFACVIDYYEENQASAGWDEMTGINLNRLSRAQWVKEMESVGFEIVEHTQLKAELAPGDTADWRHTHGSLYLLCRRPLDS